VAKGIALLAPLRHGVVGMPRGELVNEKWSRVPTVPWTTLTWLPLMPKLEIAVACLAHYAEVGAERTMDRRSLSYQFWITS
jgi:hypothetical protein